MSTTLSGLIMEEIKNCNYSRYKLICNVILGQTKGQDLQYASRCLWSLQLGYFRYRQL